ncbi:MAG: hypothetical protein ACM35G_02635 [Planctomycetaceae bacterium]
MKTPLAALAGWHAHVFVGMTDPVRVHGPGWLKTRGFRVSDNRNPPVLRLSDFMETLENKGSHPVNAYVRIMTNQGYFWDAFQFARRMVDNFHTEVGFGLPVRRSS